jgi:channel protein (hemolysin III family)
MTHLFAAPVGLLMKIHLLKYHRGNSAHTLSLIVYGLSILLLLSISGTYHLLTPGFLPRAVLQRMDHAAIFILIAGTFTPIHTFLFQGWRCWGFLLGVWLFALTGIIIKTIFFAQFPESLSVGLYLAFGWCGVVTILWLYRDYGPSSIALLILGGLSYSFGATLDFLRLPTLINGVVGPHECFHLAVLLGIFLHWLFIRKIAVVEGFKKK